jgi:Fic family protein
MKIPMPPPRLNEILKQYPKTLVELSGLLGGNNISNSPYLPWDKMRHHTPPDGLTHEEWWFVTKLARTAGRRKLPLLAKDGTSLHYVLPDQVLRAVEEINRDASGQIVISEQVANPATRDRYLVSSLMEEAITSSQLEGAATTRQVAKEMLRSGRPPRTRDERMILNNYRAMRLIGELRTEELTPEIIFDIHRTVTEGTLENPGASGRLQTSDEDRVAVYDSEDNLLHRPPAVAELPDRVHRLCDFANGKSDEAYIPPVLRAITIHFMLSYDHPFEDGNGRTARALFYWSMLNRGYWLTEFLTISKILKAAPSKYARSFLHTEQDENDLTYFHIYQLEVVQRSIQELHKYLAAKMGELRELQQSLSILPGGFNYRQLAVLENAINNPGARYTTTSHSTSHNVTIETARIDLTDLEKRGLLTRYTMGKAFVWTPVDDLSERLRPA